MKPIRREGIAVKTVVVEIEAGLLVRRQLRRWLARQKFANRLVRVNWREDRGWLDSQFLIDVSGDPVAVEGWRLATRDMVERWAA